MAIARWMYLATVYHDLHVRGLRYISDIGLATRLARQAARAECRREGNSGIQVHPAVPLSLQRDSRGLLAVGPTGAGKTQVFLPMLLDMIAAGHRVILYDDSGEYLERLPLSAEQFILIAPWDERGVVWDIAADVVSGADARLVASKMIPPTEEPIWSDASRQLFAGLITWLNRTRRASWGFPDLAQLLQADNARLAEILKKAGPEASRLLQSLMSGSQAETAHSVLINLMSCMSVVFDLARYWGADEVLPDAWWAQGFSVTRWLSDSYDGPRVILLQGSEKHETLRRGLHSALISMLIAHVTDSSFPEAASRQEDWRLYVVLDEFAQLHKLPIDRLISVGRRKGVRLLLGFQNIAQPKKIYGPDVTETIFSQLGTQFYGRVPPSDTANWISSIFSSREIERLSQTVSSREQSAGDGESLSWQTREQKLILPGQLATELGAGPDGVTGLLYQTGQPYLLRLHWPITTLPKVREASAPAPTSH
jgi:type IV secretory pathway TraG/TraD family ATPase VirD4